MNNYHVEYQYYENNVPKRLRNMEIKSELKPDELATVLDCLADCSIIDSHLAFDPAVDKVSVTSDDTLYRRTEEEYLEFYHDENLYTSVFTVRKTGENDGKTIEQLILEAWREKE